MAIEKSQTCTTRPKCPNPASASYAWASGTQYACTAHLPDAERVATLLGRPIDPQPYPPPAPPKEPPPQAKPAAKPAAVTKPPAA